MANDLNRYYSNCSTSLVFREMQITRMMRDHFISTRMAIIKKKKDGQWQVLMRMLTKWNPHTLLVRMPYITATLENNLVIPQNIPQRLTI